MTAPRKHADTIDTLCAEKDRLTTCLEKANASAEHFEREWYLRGDEIDTLRAQLAAVAVPSETPEGWRNQFAEAVYADLEAADTQDVPLEEYPMRIIKVLDSVVGPRHPTVIHWRNDAIQACIAIAYKYCRDPETFQYLKQDLQSLIFAAPTTQPAAQQGEPS